MKLEFTFEEMGAWSRVPADLKASLADDLQADVVVIGGGCTGLSTALRLRAAGADVIVLEEDFAGCGASGRNTGVVTGAIVQDLSLTRRLLGPELAAARASFADAAVEYLEEMIELHQVQCDYTPSGTLLVNVHPSQEAELNKKGEIAQEYGSPVRFLSSGEMRARGLPPAFLSGVLEEQGGTLDPGKYVFGVEGRHGNILYGLGYAGHGLSQGTLMGAVLAERILGREHRLEAAVRRRVRRWPPEPFRWVGAKLLISRLMAADRRIDRKLRRASG
jgi:glycine/D-amino acid oxidase-like deaminating enzyme